MRLHVEHLVGVDLARFVRRGLGDRLRVRPAAVLHRDHLPVGLGDLVAAHPEAGLQRAGQRQEEPAGATGSRRLPGHRAVRAVLAGEPPVGGLQPAQPRHHPDPAQAQLEGGLLDLWVVGEQVGRYQPGIVRGARQQVAGAQVAGLQPLAPRHPVRRAQRVLARQQHHLGHRGFGLRRPHHGDRPVPADVAGQRGGEGVGDGKLALRLHAEVLTDLGTGHLHGSGPGQLHRLGGAGVQALRLARIGHLDILALIPPPRSGRPGTLSGQQGGRCGRIEP